ncbi:D-alanyl-D-alanine carboxypeptidase family protein [Acinetobacter sp. c3-l95]|uniref:D-alanyl-D-alanine carboxypeptidase family protein n=1 Tax=Acinetobacter sp. c3-l95 TaxID=3342804 RepID=UPI0035BB9B0A
MFYPRTFLAFATMLFPFSVSYSQVIDIDKNSVDAQAWVIYDAQSKQIIASDQQDVQRAPASLTKIMVAYLMLEAIREGRYSLEQKLTVPESVKSIDVLESKMDLKAGEQVSIHDLLTGLIVMSANDAALTIADNLGNKDSQKFIELMNQSAVKLGMKNTYFANASGITMDGHYSTAHDMAILSDAIINTTPEYLNFAKLQQFQFKNSTHEATNLLLKRDNTIDGLKTGYTEAAGYNFAVTANRIDPNTKQNRRIIVVILGTKSKQQRADIAQHLLNIAYTYTQNQPILANSQKLARIPIVNGQYNYYPVYLQPQQNIQTLSLLPTAQVLDLKKYDVNKQRFVLNEKPLVTIEPTTKPEGLQFDVKLQQQQLNAPMQQQNMPLLTLQVKQFDQIILENHISQTIQLQPETWWQSIVRKLSAFFQGEKNTTATIYPINT